MVKRTTAQDRLLIRKIANRRKKGRGWSEIAQEFGFNSASHAYNWFNDRAVEINGRFVPIDRIAAG